MVKSFLSRLTGKSKPPEDGVPKVDITRVMGPKPDPRDLKMQDQPDVDVETIDVELWMNADLDRLAKTWQEVQVDMSSKEARQAFSQAIHNLHGASGAYGGGALTRLTGCLQTLVGTSDDLAGDSALLNLLVQACRATAIDNTSSADIATAVCDRLEREVEKRLAA
jgi:hypothetical protein